MRRHVASIAHALERPPQLQAPFEVGDPASGYYNDLRVELQSTTPTEAARRLDTLVANRTLANHVSVAQLALGTWQRRPEEEAWTDVFRRAADWLREQVDATGGLPFLFEMPHTYVLRPPWYSAMAQGQAASVFVRAALTLGDERFVDAAMRVVCPLLARESQLLVRTEAGPVLEEYPTRPASHVLNGWIFALWGLYDASVVAAGRELTTKIRSGFEEGLAALIDRIDLYDVGGGWSRYDLYPHRLTHIASPFYHRLHIALLNATADLTGANELRAKAQSWQAGTQNPVTYSAAVARKVAFRLLVRRRAVT